LRDPKLRSSLGEVQRFTHSQEISEMPEFHCDIHYAEKAWQRKEQRIGPTKESKRWCRAQIVALYSLLARAEPSPAVELNSAVAVVMRDGPEAGLTLIGVAFAERSACQRNNRVTFGSAPSLAPNPFRHVLWTWHNPVRVPSGADWPFLRQESAPEHPFQPYVTVAVDMHEHGSPDEKGVFVDSRILVLGYTGQAENPLP
jgi:hypothetical protein